ncbi:hypothetical protein Tcan_17257 [Toxocara canis]|uniref:Uncharacterized protein n=1 Tax=Toxocara canis TaxID=6265 RepID=A0A0B2VKG5_TOXCA|nr:hypothetical protein Tcan_17257 [Toxocara canis]
MAEGSERSQQISSSSTAKQNAVTAEGPPSTSSSTVSAQSSTATPSQRKRKKYEFTYFHYDPPPYWYVWPKKPKCTKPVPHSRQITRDALHTPPGETTVESDKAATAATDQKPACPMPTYTAQQSVPSSKQLSTAAQPVQIIQSQPQPAKKLSRFTVTRAAECSLPPPSAALVTPTASTQHTGLAMAGLSSETSSQFTAKPVRMQQPALSVPVPVTTTQLVTVAASSETALGQAQPPLKFIVTPVEGETQKFKVTSVPEQGLARKQVPSSFLITTAQERPAQPSHVATSSNMPLLKEPQLATQIQQSRQFATDQAITQTVPSQPSNLTFVLNQPTNANIAQTGSVMRTGAISNILPVIAEQPEIEQREDATQADSISASSSRISTVSSNISRTSLRTTRSSAETNADRLRQEWKTIIMPPEEPTLCFVVDSSAQQQSQILANEKAPIEQTPGKNAEAAVEASHRDPSSTVKSKQKIMFTELYERVIDECKQTEAIFERFNNRLCDLERIHEQLRARTTNRPVQYSPSQ